MARTATGGSAHCSPSDLRHAGGHVGRAVEVTRAEGREKSEEEDEEESDRRHTAANSSKQQ